MARGVHGTASHAHRRYSTPGPAPAPAPAAPYRPKQLVRAALVLLLAEPAPRGTHDMWESHLALLPFTPYATLNTVRWRGFGVSAVALGRYSWLDRTWRRHVQTVPSLRPCAPRASPPHSWRACRTTPFSLRRPRPQRCDACGTSWHATGNGQRTTDNMRRTTCDGQNTTRAIQQTT
jgi:hypothetical protein